MKYKSDGWKKGFMNGGKIMPEAKEKKLKIVHWVTLFLPSGLNVKVKAMKQTQVKDVSNI